MGAPRDGGLLPGTLDMLILKAVTCKRMHGYGIAEWIAAFSEDALCVEEGALYPALHRLELKGLLAAEWGLSQNNRRARYYKITPAGRKALTVESDRWARMSLAIGRIMESS